MPLERATQLVLIATDLFEEVHDRPGSAQVRTVQPLEHIEQRNDCRSWIRIILQLLHDLLELAHAVRCLEVLRFELPKTLGHLASHLLNLPARGAWLVAPKMRGSRLTKQRSLSRVVTVPWCARAGTRALSTFRTACAARAAVAAKGRRGTSVADVRAAGPANSKQGDDDAQIPDFDDHAGSPDHRQLRQRSASARACAAARRTGRADQDDLDARSRPRNRALHVLPRAGRGPLREPPGGQVHAGKPPRADLQDPVHGVSDHDHQGQHRRHAGRVRLRRERRHGRLGDPGHRGRSPGRQWPARHRRPAERHRVEARRQQRAARQCPLPERGRQAARRRDLHQPPHRPGRASDPRGGDLLPLQPLHIGAGRVHEPWRARSAPSAPASRW